LDVYPALIAPGFDGTSACGLAAGIDERHDGPRAAECKILRLMTRPTASHCGWLDSVKL
jgi:hypothetical protein